MNTLRNFGFTEEILKKIFTKEKACEFAERYCVTHTRKRSTKENPKGALKNPYDDILNLGLSPRQVCDLCVEFVTTGDGKYVEKNINGKKSENIEQAISYREELLAFNEELHRALRKEYYDLNYDSIYAINNDDRDICLPDAFSDSITKPLMRKQISVAFGSAEYSTNLDIYALLSKIHFVERTIAQLAGDIAELRFLIAMKGDAQWLIFPTSVNRKGDDFLLYDLNTLSFGTGDAKTSRFPKHFDDPDTESAPMPTRNEAMNRPAEAIRRLYKKQGIERFSSAPRWLLVRTPPGEKPNTVECIREQFNKTYNFNFYYKEKKETFDVKGARIVFF